MDSDTLRKLQLTELTILQDLDAFCRKHEIHYSLYAGTLLGAVRHQGFIPWDDDIDVAMSRAEYTRFCRAWERDPIPGYSFSNYENDPFCQNNHGKLHKDGTVLLSNGEDECVGNHGIWVDLFPLDKIPVKGSRRRKLLFAAARTVLLTRANATNSTNTRLQKTVRSLFRLIPYPVRKRQLLRDLKVFRQNVPAAGIPCTWNELSTMAGLTHFAFPMNDLTQFVSLSFEGCLFPCYAEYETILSVLYGDYMQLPPVSQRICTHDPVVLRFSED